MTATLCALIIPVVIGSGIVPAGIPVAGPRVIIGRLRVPIAVRIYRVLRSTFQPRGRRNLRRRGELGSRRRGGW
jgi:hypothetical protein